MANIVELREKSNEEIVEMVENLREEMFNLRFQHAGSRVANPIRIRDVRREMAQLHSVLGQRESAIAAAATHPDIANALSGKDWAGTAAYVYEDQGFAVKFEADGKEVATAKVDLNKKQPRSRRQRTLLGYPKAVVSYDVK